MYEMGVFDALRKGFTYIGYPVIILAAFLVIVARMRALFTEHDFNSLMQWRLAVAGLLPVAVLTFVVVGELPDTVSWLPTADQWKTQLLLGAVLAVGTLEASQHVSGNKQALSFMLYLSALGTGLLYVVMEGALARFQPAVFAIVLTGGLHFVFRETETWDDEPQETLEQGVLEDTPAEWVPRTSGTRKPFVALNLDRRKDQEKARR